MQRKEGRELEKRREDKLQILHGLLIQNTWEQNFFGSEILKYLHIHKELLWQWDAYLNTTLIQVSYSSYTQDLKIIHKGFVVAFEFFM